VEILGLILTTVGAIPVLWAAGYWLLRYRPAKRLLGFREKEPIDVIITTSSIARSQKGAGIIRATTGIGQVQGVAFLSRVLGRFYRKKPISLNFSEKAPGRLKRDLLLLGGPAKNECSKLFMDRFIEEHPNLNLVFDDLNCVIRIGELCIDKNRLQIKNGYPENDFGLVVVWKNPFSVEKRRGIFCAGFTSYGTSGAANWFFDDLVMEGKLNFKNAKFLSKGQSLNFLAIVEATLLQDQVIAVRLLEMTIL
jgi:hypothetical protein